MGSDNKPEGIPAEEKPNKILFSVLTFAPFFIGFGIGYGGLTSCLLCFPALLCTALPWDTLWGQVTGSLCSCSVQVRFYRQIWCEDRRGWRLGLDVCSRSRSWACHQFHQQLPCIYVQKRMEGKLAVEPVHLQSDRWRRRRQCHYFRWKWEHWKVQPRKSIDSPRETPSSPPNPHPLLRQVDWQLLISFPCRW